MNIFVDTIKYKINGLSVNTQDFSQYLSNNGIKNYDESVEHKKSNYKSSIYKRVSNECRDFIKGSANYFTIFKTFVDGKNKNIFFEFYGLKSYCQCIDELRDNVIKLFPLIIKLSLREMAATGLLPSAAYFLKFVKISNVH